VGPVLLAHIPAQLAQYGRRRSTKALRDELDGAAALDADEHFLSFFKRHFPTAGLGLDVCRDHAASLTEPPPTCVLIETQRQSSFSSQLTGTDEQPELAD
jgi:hypothetical protein